MLTHREEEVMKFTAWGASAKEVADYLHISTVTVQNHIHNIKDKLKLQKATEIAAWFFCHTFNISMDLSPLRRQIGSMTLIALFIFSMINNDDMNLRNRRGRNSRRTEIEIVEDFESEY